MTWYRDRAALRWIAMGYLPWLALLNLAWEVAHVRLYTLWHEAGAAYIAFSVLHCTLGDVLIGGAALLLALILGRERALPDAARAVARAAATRPLSGPAALTMLPIGSIRTLRGPPAMAG